MGVASAPERRLVHEALIYSSDDELLLRLVPFLRDGLAAGEPAIAVLPPDRIAVLREALGDDAVRVMFADAGALYRRPAHAIAQYRRHLDAALDRPGVELVRVIGEVQFGAAAKSHAEWTRFESMLNRAFAGFPAWIVCPYDARALPDQVVADAFRTHPCVSTGGQPEASDRYTEPEELFEWPLGREAVRAGDPHTRLTVANEGELDELRRVVAGAARAAGLASALVDDVTVGVEELVRDAVRHGAAEARVELARDGARWHCDVIERKSGEPALDKRVGLSIAQLIGERVEVDSGTGVRTVRLTFAGAAEARQRILAAASELFYQQGIRATGVNTIIAHSGVAKATFFKRFPAKEDLVVAWLRQPTSRWFDRIRAELAAKSESPASRLLSFFDLLGEWFAREDFRGCAFQNAAAESPDASHPIRQATHAYAGEIRQYLRRTAREAGLSNPAGVAEQLHLLAQGAIATAVATRSPDAARIARAAARRILAEAKSRA